MACPAARTIRWELVDENGVDHQYRIQGTPAAFTIGQATTSGCFRMLNADVIELYGLVKIGTRVVVKPGPIGF
jgi:lipoprotein-anchoring transpeptidase ErfK/SrfK